MLTDAKAFSSFSIDDPAAAKSFYGETLGLKVDELPEGLRLNLIGASVFLYQKPDHQPATFTVLNFSVDSVDTALEQLTGRGVRFEHYDMPDLKTDEKGIFRGDGNGPAIAWFKDPAGNILSILEE
jgi:catechol 2,3-dioxygenase-like lactoylglutathione lyase family enzyme